MPGFLSRVFRRHVTGAGPNELVVAYSRQPYCSMNGLRARAIDVVAPGLANCPVCPGELADGRVVYNRARSLDAAGRFVQHRLALAGRPIMSEAAVDRYLASLSREG